MAGVLSRRNLAFHASLLLAAWGAGVMPRASAQDFAPPAEIIDPQLVPTSVAGAQEMVVDVRVEGNRTVSQAKVFQQIETRIGRPFKKDVVERDVKQLASRGWFLDVRPLTQQVPGGRIVIFRVTERPTLRYVEYLGNKSIRDKPLSKETGLKVGDAVDPYAVEEARRKIIQYYQERGFNKGQVEIKEGVKTTDNGAVFVINEGPRERVASVTFIGNTIASDARLKTQIESKPGFLWLFKGFVNRQKIDEDVDRLTAYYRSLGFFRARIGRELEFGETGWLSLRFVIDEGPRFKVRSVSFVGNKQFNSDDLRNDMKLVSGEYFNQDKMNLDLGTLRDIYGSYGYVFADIKASPRTLEGQPELDLVYDVQEGGRYRIGRIRVHIEGENPHTRTKAVMNRLSMRTGDIMDIREMRNSERRLKAAAIFETDPMSGGPPKVMFSPPENDGLEDEAGGGKFRGQSPDPIPVESSSAAPILIPHYRPETGEVDFDIDANRLRFNDAELHYYRQHWSRNPTLAEFQYQARRPNSGMQVRAQSPGDYPPNAHSAYAQPHTAYSQPGAPVYGQPAVQQSYPANAPRCSARQSVCAGQRYGGYGIPPAGRASSVVAQTATNTNPYAGQANQMLLQFNTSNRSLGNQRRGGGATRCSPGKAAMSCRGASANRPMAPGAGPSYSGPGPAVAYGPNGEAVATNQVAYLPSGADGQYPPLFSQPYNPNPYYEPIPELPLDVVVHETQTGRFMVGVGVNSDAGVVGSVTIDERNFDWRRVPTSWEDFRNGTAWRGAGQRLRIELLPGTQVQRYMVSFQEPYLLDTPVSLSLSGFFFNRNYLEWNEERLGGRVGLGYQLTPDLSTTISYRGENVNVNHPVAGAPQEILDAVGDNALHGFKLSAAHDTRDSAFLATEGHYIELSGEQVIGTWQYARAEIDAKQYFMLYQRPDGSGRHVMSLTGHVGFSGEDTPVYDNYFAGGFSTFRGFAFRGASPRINGVTVGGRFMMLGSVEYLFPITANDMLRGVVFTDFGTVERNIEIEDFRVAPGVGLRITVPALGPAPIALDFAVPAVKAEGDREQVFSFNIGFLR